MYTKHNVSNDQDHRQENVVEDTNIGILAPG